MASKYTNEWNGAFADVLAAGDSITFTRHVAGTVSDSTDAETGASSSTHAGVAVEDKGKSDVYARLGLTHQTGVTLFFVPSEIDDIPLAGDTATWAGDLVTVKERVALAPDGVAIAATVVCQR